MYRVLIISFEKLLDIPLNIINRESVDIGAIITIKTNVTKDILDRHKVNCPVYSYDYLSEILRDYYYDYILLCGFEEKVVKDLKELHIAKSKIIDLRASYLPDMISLIQTVKHYLLDKTPYEIFITGLSYTYFGTNLKSYQKSIINFSGISQDIYYGYELMQYILQKKPNGFKYGLVAALLICPNPALNYCRKLLMSFAV